MKRLIEIANDLVKLLQQLNKVAIELISLVGWLLILMKLFN